MVAVDARPGITEVGLDNLSLCGEALKTSQQSVIFLPGIKGMSLCSERLTEQLAGNGRVAVYHYQQLSLHGQKMGEAFGKYSPLDLSGENPSGTALVEYVHDIDGERMARALEIIDGPHSTKWLLLVPQWKGQFRLLTALTDWIEKNNIPQFSLTLPEEILASVPLPILPT